MLGDVGQWSEERKVIVCGYCDSWLTKLLVLVMTFAGSFVAV